MKHYKNTATNTEYCFEDDAVEKALAGEEGVFATIAGIIAECTEYTAEELDAAYVPKYSDEFLLAREEYYWASGEISTIDIEINKITDGDTRAVSTLEAWTEYRKALRNYCTKSDEGVFSIVTDKPVRPS
jgi:hypothetical protein